jgi:hypothetical protein
VSNFLAVATVTATLEQIILAVAPNDVPGANVTNGRPDDSPGANQEPRVNIFLYQVRPNAALRNQDLPIRRPDGTLVQRPQVALDLYYILTFYGDETRLEPQRLLGSVVNALHGEPLLTPEQIRDGINAHNFLAASNLDRQVESVKFLPLPLNLEELSKLWSVFFQTPYALSIAYQASVVLIESEVTPQPALPVRERILRAVPMAQPIIERVVAEDNPQAPITASSTIQILGRGLRGEETQVRIAGVEVAPSQIGDRQLTLPLASLPADTLRAGVQGLQVTHRFLLGDPPQPHRGIDSNVAPFVLHPTISDVAAPDATTVTVTFEPRVGRAQRVVLLLNELDPPSDQAARAFRFDAPPDNGITDPSVADTPTISFSTSGVEPGVYLARVQVDGAESPLEVDADGRYDEPQVTI